MNLRSALLAFSLLGAYGAGCVIVDDSTPAAYEACSGGGTCLGGTACQQASYVAGTGTANFCTAGCTATSGCPSSSFNNVYAPTCVLGPTGVGQCFDSCNVDADCGTGTVCRRVPGTAATVCVPIASGGSSAPVTLGLYSQCGAPNTVCGGGSCIQSLYMAAGTTTPGSTCTAICPGGDARMCPGYVAGQVECVNATGNPSMFQCVRLCQNDNQCAPFGTRCLQVTLGGGVMNRICAP